MTITEAYAYCKTIATEHYENFPVASMLLPKSMRDHLFAIYAFARTADDIADEGDIDSQRRLQGLQELRNALHGHENNNPIIVALRHTITACKLPLELFDRLLAAFEQDVNFTAFQSWDNVMAYCHNSANPVGELFLRLAYTDSEPPVAAIACSNDICSALQITNFLQDIRVDEQRGRTYLPFPEAEVVAQTRLLYQRGSRVMNYAPTLRLKLELWMIIHGGKTMLHLCEHRAHRNQRPTLTFAALLMQLFRRA